MGEAHVLHTLLKWPAFASWLAIPATQSSEVGGWLLTPRVAFMIAHAVHVIIVSLNAHTGSVSLNPFARLRAPAVAPVW
jgi:hypothetical protein